MDKSSSHRLGTALLSSLNLEVNDLSDHTWLVTTDGDLLSANEASYEFRPKHVIKPSNASLIQLLECVLTTNNFQFNGQQYFQVGVTSMGTKVAPGYANNFIGKFEMHFVYIFPTQPLLWKKDMDDCFFILTGTEDRMNDFLNDRYRGQNE